MPSPTRRRPRSTGRIDGLKVRIIDDLTASDVDLGRALRTLARLMVRRHQAERDHTAITNEHRTAFQLTVATDTHPVHDTSNEAA